MSVCGSIIIKILHPGPRQFLARIKLVSFGRAEHIGLIFLLVSLYMAEAWITRHIKVLTDKVYQIFRLLTQKEVLFSRAVFI